MRSVFLCLAAVFAVRASAQEDGRATIFPPALRAALRAIPPDSLPLPLESVRVVGNDHTAERVITRELPMREGEPVTRAALAEAQQRIYNLGLFNKVEVLPARDTSGRRVRLYIGVSERWYIFPVLVLGRKYRDWDDLYYGAGVVHYNVAGLGQKLFLGFALGYDPWVNFDYSGVELDRARTLGLSFGGTWSRTKNISDTLYTGGVPFDELRWDAYVRTQWRPQLAFTAWAEAGFESLRLSNPAARRTLDPSGTDRTPIVKLGAQTDTRDVIEYPLAGGYALAEFAKDGFSSTINYARLAVGAARYQPLGPGSLCATAAGIFMLGGRVPVYAHVYLGTDERVRGEFFNQREGEELAVGRLEYRLPLLAPFFTTWEGAPAWVPSQFTVWKFALYLEAFADAGVVLFRDQRLADQRWSNGTGAGLALIVPFGLVGRLDWAFHGTPRAGEILFDVGAAF